MLWAWQQLCHWWLAAAAVQDIVWWNNDAGER